MTRLTVKVPASTMLFGEHSVLRNGPAIVAAIDCWMTLSITQRTDNCIIVESSLGTATTSVNTLCLGHSFRFIEAALKRFPPTNGLSIHINSDIESTVGLGSSAAVTVGMLLALSTLHHQENSNLLQKAVSLIRNVQGQASGADAASIIYGGVIAFRNQSATRLCSSLPLSLLYSGMKTPTADVINHVNEQEKKDPKFFAHIFAAIDYTTECAIQAIRDNNMALCGALMNRADALMHALGVGTATLSSLCRKLRQSPTIYGAKISGSGLGDCVVGLGTYPSSIPSTVSSRGAHVLDR